MKAVWFARSTTALQAGVDWFSEQGRSTTTAVTDIGPGSVVAEAFARTLAASGRFGDIELVLR